MVDVTRATALALAQFPFNAGTFYGSAAGLALGVGLVVDCVAYPLFDESERLFDTVAGPAYVLTHECDIDSANDRAFNDYVLICPIICFATFAREFAADQSESALFGFIPDLAANRIFRALYIPPVHTALPYGGILYFNQICSTHVETLRASSARPLCALSQTAQRVIDYKLVNHLLRPKADVLPRLH